MRACVVAILLAAGGCGMFGQPADRDARSATAPPARAAAPLLGGVETLISETALRGVILRAAAVPATQGWYGAAFRRAGGADPRDPRAAPPADGTLTLELRAFPPAGPMPVGSPASRRVHTAIFLPESDLDGVTRFDVRTAQGVVTLRR